MLLATTTPLLLWHGAHRIFHGLHDLLLRRGPLAWAVTYGLALGFTAIPWGALSVSVLKPVDRGLRSARERGLRARVTPRA